MKLKSEVSPAQVLAQMYEMLRMIERGEVHIESMFVESSPVHESAVTVSLRLRGPDRYAIRDMDAMMQARQAFYPSIPPPPGSLVVDPDSLADRQQLAWERADGMTPKRAAEGEKPEKPKVPPQKRELIFD